MLAANAPEMVKINAIRNTAARIAWVTCLILVRSLTHLAAQPIGIVSLVRQHDGALAQMPEQVGGNRGNRRPGPASAPVPRAGRASVRAWISVVTSARRASGPYSDPGGFF